MTSSERRAINKEILGLTENTYDLGALSSDREAADYLASAKRNYPDFAPCAHVRLAAEDVIEYAIAAGNISLDEEFAN